MAHRLTCSAISALLAGTAWLALVPGATAQQPRPQQPVPPQQQQSQQQAAPQRIAVVELTQPLLDRWLAFVADVVPRLGAGDQISDDKASAIFADACKKAGFADENQCQGVDDYMNALVAGGDEQAGRFGDPITKARSDLKALLADKSVPAKEKQEARREIEAFIATLPEKVPEAHLALLNNNAKRIFETLARVQQPPPGAPAPAPQGGQGKGPPAKR
ncbi:MAG TPA: hypothetical protein VFV47_03160 [Hyphomicrobiaceae bacterium]|nr:hypothetical protein [Hyphomicrobiaceae bacterium]